MIEVNYKTTLDYSVLNPSQFIKIDKILNLVLIPNIPKHEDFLKIKPTDTVIINKSKYKVALESGFIVLNNQSYFYFYIAPGIKYNPLNHYSFNMIYGTHELKLDSNLEQYSAKLLFGLLVLPDNLLYLFNNHKSIIVSDGQINYNLKLVNLINKYNFYMAQKNNTLVNILDPLNFAQLKFINSNYHNHVYIKPPSNPNYPLGSIEILIKGVKDKYGLNITSDSYNKNLLVESDQLIIIDNLTFGQYIIKLFDKNGYLTIGQCNSTLINNDHFMITIDKPQYINNVSKSSLLKSYQKQRPNKNTANLLINFPPKESFEIFGPNNFYKRFNSGYQYLQNIFEGYYTIKTNNLTKSIYVIKDDNNYIS